jgi:hypothetical protein
VEIFEIVAKHNQVTDVDKLGLNAGKPNLEKQTY